MNVRIVWVVLAVAGIGGGLDGCGGSLGGGPTGTGGQPDRNEAVTPQASGACDVPPCTLCNSLQGTAGGQDLDSTGAPKVGWCACKLPNAAGTRTWSCATDTAWPCPLGSGC